MQARIESMGRRISDMITVLRKSKQKDSRFGVKSCPVWHYLNVEQGDFSYNGQFSHQKVDAPW
jgi:hypothetical protein